MVAESSSGIAELQGNTVRARRAVAELKQRAIARQQEYRKEVESQLADVSREVSGRCRKIPRHEGRSWVAPKSNRQHLDKWLAWPSRL
jgi:hypothetical protein